MELARLYGMSPGLAMKAYREGRRPAHFDWPCVYVFVLSNGRVKVGFSTHVVGRVNEIGKEAGTACRAYWAIRTPDALDVEYTFHIRHRQTPTRSKGSEYYVMEPAKAVAAIRSIIAEKAYPNTPDPTFGVSR